MTRTVMRFVDHAITHMPYGGITAHLFCMATECGQGSGPRAVPEDAQGWDLRHTGRTGHELFRREYTGHARVTRHE